MAAEQEIEDSGEMPSPVLPKERVHGSAPEKRRRMADYEEGREFLAAEEEQALAASFTPEVIEELIEGAMVTEGEEGSLGEAATSGSQRFHLVLRERIHSYLEGSEATRRVEDLGGLISNILEMFEDMKELDKERRPQPTTGKFDLYPLPVSRCAEFHPHNPEFLQAVVRALNSLNGQTDDGAHQGNATSVRCLKRLAASLEGSAILKAEIPTLNFDEFFSHKKVDYQGEEILLARPLVWESLEAAFPLEVGQLYLRDFCSEGVLHFVDNFDDYMLPQEDMVIGKCPRVMVEDDHWEKVATGLVERGLCKVLRESELFHVGSSPLVNGMFSVSKQEFKGDIELTRLIMNLKPLNANSRNLEGDTSTLPSITGMGGLYLDGEELLLTSSEDIKCFFYLFRVPESWIRYLGFGRVAPASIAPEFFGAEKGFLASVVLPMGYVNSVGIAEHVHRNVLRRAMGDMRPLRGAEGELRRDRPFSQSPKLVRIYLDNFDELCKVDRRTAEMIKGKPSDMVKVLREHYVEQGLPRHPKKSVESKVQTEVQGGWLDGEAGTLSAKPGKIAKYVALALETLRRGSASQKELQVIGGGLVYICMFRRPLLSSLNQIWRSIVDLDSKPRGFRAPLRREVALELVRFLGLLPLAFVNFRAGFDSQVTASDASTTGGGACVSRGLSPYGLAASLSRVRGDVPEEVDINPILSIGLFDGIAALRVALDALRLPVAGHISVERSEEAHRVVEAHFPDCIKVR